jgi:hypothetical protein
VVQPVWQKVFQPVWQKTFQQYKIPVYEKKISSASGTLVSRLQYSGTDAKAVATDGGSFNNGHTYVAVPASGKEKTILIADSSSNSNGKKTPAEYNTPIKPEYSYTAKVVDGKMVITFDDRLVSTSVGGYVATAGAKNNNGNGNNKGVSIADMFPGNAPSHKTVTNGGKLELDLTGATIIDGNYYIYIHF